MERIIHIRKTRINNFYIDNIEVIKNDKDIKIKKIVLLVYQILTLFI